MERKISKHWPGFKVLCILLLLSLENSALGSINPGNLKKIIKYITDYGIGNSHYAVAVRLDANYCQDPTPANLQAALPTSVMDQMHEAIQKKSGTYPEQFKNLGNVVAAKPKTDKAEPFEHAEWRLLNGGQNSPTARLLENKPHDSCLIFFSKLAPCTDRCLNPNDANNIVKWLDFLFNPLNEDSRAFVFESVFWKDANKEPEVLVEAWKAIRHAPLFRYDANNEDCIWCFDNNDVIDPRCLPPQK